MNHSNHSPLVPSTLGTAAIAAALALTVPDTAQADGGLCSPPAFDAAGFQYVVDQQLGGFKGYSVTLARPGEIAATRSGGVAVDGVDTVAPVPMNGATPGNVGSTAKVMSSVALLQIFEDDPSATVEEWLDRDIVDYFPNEWQLYVHSPASPIAIQNVAFVTFRDMLQHRSGLAQFDNFIVEGINLTNLQNGVRQYSNGNIAVIAYMLPYILSPAAGAAFDAQFVGETPSMSSSSLYTELLRPYFGDYMQDNIFDPIPVSMATGVTAPYGLWSETLEPSCNHKQTYARTPYFRDLDWGIAGDVPHVGDIDADGDDELIVWRPSDGKWFARTVEGTVLTSGMPYGVAAFGDIPLVGDVNGDSQADYVIWREDTGEWFAKSSGGVVLNAGTNYGVSGDVPLVGNVGGNPADDLVIWRPSTGRWYAKQNNGVGLLSAVAFGTSGDVPHLGDVNGDGVQDLVLWRPSTGQWFAHDPVTSTTIVNGLAWGTAGDVSMVGDADGDGTDDFFVFRPSTGEWYARNAAGVYFREEYFGSGEVGGAGSIVPLLGNFSGDYKHKLTVFRESNGHWSAGGRRYSLGYASTASLGPGLPSEFLAEPPGCQPQGGYWMSSMEYAAWAAALSNGDIVSPALLDAMHDESDPNERLGWRFSSVAPGFISSNYGVTRIPWHDGAQYGYSSAIVQLPNGYYGFGYINDGSGNTGDVYSAIVDGWIEAVDGDCEN